MSESKNTCHLVFETLDQRDMFISRYQSTLGERMGCTEVLGVYTSPSGVILEVFRLDVWISHMDSASLAVK